MHEDSIADLLPHSRFGAITNVTELTKGLSGAVVHAVTTTVGEYVVRRVTAQDVATWQRELAIHRLASDAGIAPPLEWVDEAAPATVSRRIIAPSSGAFGEPEARPRVLASVVEQLATLHALPVDGIAGVSPLDVARGVWNQQSARPGFPAWAMPLAEHFTRCEQLFAVDSRRVLSHNDLNPANILWDGERAWLVDWEASGAAHPYYDLATISMFLSLSDDVALALLAAQERAPISVDQAETFRALRRLTNIFYGAVFISLVSEIESAMPARAEDAPTIPQLYAMLGSGAINLRSPQGQIAFGSALLRTAVEERAASASSATDGTRSENR